MIKQKINGVVYEISFHTHYEASKYGGYNIPVTECRVRFEDKEVLGISRCSIYDNPDKNKGQEAAITNLPLSKEIRKMIHAAYFMSKGKWFEEFNDCLPFMNL